MKFSGTLAFLFLSIALSGSTFAGGSDRSLRIAGNIVLPKDNIESQKLKASLNKFLLAAQEPNEKNEFVFDSERIETFIQLDEMKGIEKSSGYKEDFFYKPYLTNVVLLKEKNYLIQVSYIGINEGLASLRASFEFIAHPQDGSFTFSSPLLRNTADWKVKRVGDSIFHYRNTINEKRVKEFNELTSLFDSKLKVPKKVTDYYCTGTTIEMQKLIGIDYKSDHNGQAEGVRSAEFGDRKVIVLGNDNSTFDAFDAHDLFHDRLSLVISRSKLNRPVDEGYAYLYGGSWGFTWKEIFKAFKEQIASNKNANWTEIKETPTSFKTGNYPNSADYIVNALLVKKIEKERGFAGVRELLTVGPFEKGNDKYYQTLERLTGITKASYNDKIWELINREK